MKANEFVKKYGWDGAKAKVVELNILEELGDKSRGQENELKRLVESCDLVESVGGLDKAKKYLSVAIQNKSETVKCKNFLVVHKSMLKQAIADVEKCQ